MMHAEQINRLKYLINLNNKQKKHHKNKDQIKV